VLTLGYRVPRQITDFAGRLLPHIAPELTPAVSVREAVGSLAVRAVDAAALDRSAIDACRNALELEGSVGVIAADARVGRLVRLLRRAQLPHQLLGSDDTDQSARLSVVSASLAKGLEFDHLVVVEPAEIVEAEPRGLRRLYVVLTRAVSGLIVLHARPLPEPLGT